MIDRLLFESRPTWIMKAYRTFYPLMIIVSLWFERGPIFSRADSVLCHPLAAHNPEYAFYLLIGALLCLSAGFFQRASATASTLLFLWVIGSTISCASGPNPDYVPWHHAIVPFNLIVLAVAPLGSSQPNWPIFLLKFNLVYAYFAGGIAKVKFGFDWMNGYSLQAHLIYSHLHAGAPAVLPLIGQHGLLVAISITVVLAELASPLALISRRFAIFFICGSLIFQLIFYWLIDLRWMNYFGWSYLIYLLEAVAVSGLIKTGDKKSAA